MLWSSPAGLPIAATSGRGVKLTERRILQGAAARTLAYDRAGFWPARVSPIWAVARVPLSNPPRPWSFSADRGPQGFRLSRQPTGVGPAAAGALAGAEAMAAEAAARAARPGRLEDVQKV